MEAIKYYPNFVQLVSDDIKVEPFTFIKKGTPPSSDFIVSKSSSGEPLSIYSDDLWDFRPYRLSGDTGNARFNFSIFSEGIKGEVKWLMFLLLFVVESGRATGISISSCMNYFKAIRTLARFSEERNLSIYELIKREELMVQYIGSIKTRGVLRGISSVLSHLITIPSEISGYKVLSTLKFEALRQKSLDLGDDTQHPVIPNRIYSSLIKQLDEFISGVYDNKDKLEGFLVEVLKCDRFGRSPELQRKIGYYRKDFKPYFKEASQEYGLWEYFSRYQVKNMPSLSTFIVRMQHGCRIMLHIFSGMRAGESLSLPMNSLMISDDVYKLSGTTSKFVGQKKETSWITSKEILKAYELAEMLAKLIASVIKLPEKEVPLFVSSSYLSLANLVRYDGVQLTLASASNKQAEIYNYLDHREFVVTSEDLDELEKMNPFRAWESEEAFSVGATWRFTIHQFRRSLAFYVAQSALVSLPSLKRQLKHVSREMTIYYAKSVSMSDEFDDSTHIAQLMKREKPEADAIAYISDVLNSKETLYGAHGTFIERNNLKTEAGVVFSSDRSTIEKQFKNGEIAYAETALGACTTITPCDKKLLRSISSCLTCARSVIKESRLNRVIARQKIFVKDLSDTMPESIEYRTEKDELDSLLKYQQRILGNEETL